MPKKYHVNTAETAPRFAPLSRFSAIESEGCLGCLECVKRTSCVYGVYKDRTFDPHTASDSADYECINCMRCVQECKKRILTRVENRSYATMGDEYWRPEMISNIWKQARTGKIPVSGAGYRGPFVGEGFDQIWTDMSEIVRPTRDGIHGREYISTSIDVGRRPESLSFDDDGKLTTQTPPLLDLPIPMLMDPPNWPVMSPVMQEAMVAAAAELGTLIILDPPDAKPLLERWGETIAIRFDPERDDVNGLAGARLIEIADNENVFALAERIRRVNETAVISIRLLLDENAPERAAELALGGAENIHLHADTRGQGRGARSDTFVTTLLREVHGRVVTAGVRDQLSILVTGGIGMAEHIAKAIICGADGVAADIPLLVGMECRLCASCPDGTSCPVGLETIDPKWGARRLVNLFGSWHSQLLEVLGAMGIREVRRLRGETGRAMFFEDLEAESFAPIFGTRNAPADNGHPKAPVDSLNESDIPADESTNRCASRFRNQLTRYRVVRSTACIACGKCAEICDYGVHRQAGPIMAVPRSEFCQGADYCKSQGACCVDVCPVDALRVGQNPEWKTFGDPRWPAELLEATWRQAETGRVDPKGGEYRVGASGGGFDRIDFVFPDDPKPVKLEDIDLRIPLNRTGDNRPDVTIGMPIYGGGMSFGSVNEATIVARARAYSAMDSFTCSGEGGYPEKLKPYDDHVITQVATGLFGVREETVQRVRMVEFKYAQGAKPGLGGHLLGDKVTESVARMREAVQGSSLFSPFPFHSVYSVEDHQKHVDWIKAISPRVLVSVKVSTPNDVDMVAVGSYYAGAHVIHIDGSYGGTGAAPDIAKKNIAMPIEYAIPKVHTFLCEEGVRDKITLIASGGVRSAWDVAKAIALGADGVVIGTAEMIALECIRCGVCESGRGCPRGIATTDAELAFLYDEDWAAQRLTNLLVAWRRELCRLLQRLGMSSIRELVGRSDVLTHLDYTPDAGARDGAAPIGSEQGPVA
ncbi:MAG: glutamate synthase-related protein [Phycisphaerae bacterium]|jgi:glutamate synthase domain-containing protein 2|nr:glutamate synthase-related protein [Phycisphaerae bacterium]